MLRILAPVPSRSKLVLPALISAVALVPPALGQAPALLDRHAA